MFPFCSLVSGKRWRECRSWILTSVQVYPRRPKREEAGFERRVNVSRGARNGKDETRRGRMAKQMGFMAFFRVRDQTYFRDSAHRGSLIYHRGI